MKADIVTLVIIVFCVGVLISALDIGHWFEEEDSHATIVLQETDNS